MKWYRRRAACAVVVGLGVILTTSQAADEKAIRAQVEELAGIAAKNPDELQKKAAAWVKENKDVDLDDIMGLLKRRMKDGSGGFGVGKEATGKPEDSIETRIEKIAKSDPAKLSIKDKEDLIQALNRTRAIAAIAAATKPSKKVAGAEAKWKKFAEQMVKGSDELAKAIESGKAKDVQKAATNLHGSCTDCHAEFRD
jgi:hypothetical protein